MTTHNTDNPTYGTLTSRGQHQHLRRSLCRATEDASGKDGNDRRGTCGENGCPDSDVVQLGKCEPVAGQRRSAERCEGAESERKESSAERIDGKNTAAYFALSIAERNYVLAEQGAKLAKENERIAKTTFIISAIFIIPLVIVACVLCCVKGSGKGRLSKQSEPAQQEEYLEPSKNTPTAGIEESQSAIGEPFPACKESLSWHAVFPFPVQAVSKHARPVDSLLRATTFSGTRLDPLFQTLVQQIFRQHGFPCTDYRSFIPKTFNTTTDYADSKTYESSSPQSSRYQHVLRQVRGAAAGTAGQGGTNNTGTRRENRHTGVNVACLGNRESTADSHRTSPRTGGSTRRNTEKFTPERVEFGKNLENSGKFFFHKTLEKQGATGFSGKILENFLNFPSSPVDKVINITYNRRYKEWGSFPHSKKRLLKVCHHNQEPSNQPSNSRSVTFYDFTPTGISYKGLYATNERTTL